MKNILLEGSMTKEDKKYNQLKTIWIDVADEIMHKVIEISFEEDFVIHYSLREEVIYEYAKLLIWLENKIEEDRKNNREISKIVIQEEKEQCLNGNGREKINNTARLAYEEIWKKILYDRWIPKTKKLLGENTEKRRNISIQNVNENHFIQRAFIKKHWSKNGIISIYCKENSGEFKRKDRPFSSWGKKTKLYSNELEYYFSLLEGDSSDPLEMLLNCLPLNRKQKESLIGFFIIHYFRNPFVMERIKERVKRTGDKDSINEPMLSKAYESIFKNNKLYSEVTKGFLENKWVVVKSKKSIFMLPDSPCRIGKYSNGNGFLIFPITPKEVFFILPEIDNRNENEKIIPFYRLLTEQKCKEIAILIKSFSEREYITSPENIEIENECEEISIENIINLVNEVCI